MTKAMRLLAAAACVVLLAAGLTGPAYGFFPKGGFNLSQQLRYATWPFRDFDTDEDGTIEDGEGLEFRIETGPRGFTNAEIEQVKAGFDVWQNVPTSYVRFQFVGNIEDPVPPGTLALDYLPMVFLQVESVPEDDEFTQPDGSDFLAPGLDAFVPAITFLTYTIDTAAVEVSGNQVIVAAGTILDCDVVVNAAVHRPGAITSTTFGALDLQATIAHHVGQLLGLAYTPLNNLDPFNEVALDGAPFGLPVESAVLQITGPDGIRSPIGATPTMMPIYFLTEMPGGEFVAGWRDLAPDDISGISWLYPREDGLENYFSVQQEARTHVRDTSGVPSAPVSGAHIVAWASLSEDDTGPRVPLFSTMTGLYQKSSNVQLQGKFNLMGLWKQLELPGGVNEMYIPSYVFTMNALNGTGYNRQAPADLTSDLVDSLQGAFPISYSLFPRPSGSFSTNYPSEVFNEYGNVYGIDNNMTGTPLSWSYEKNTMVSRESDKTLPNILPNTKPMFGDQDVVCPMNIIENIGGGTTDGETVLDAAAGLLGSLDSGGSDSGGSGGAGSGALFARVNEGLRSFRDRVLLKSAVGTAVVDLYYRAAPFMARQLLHHDAVLRAVRGVILLGARIGESGMMIASLMGCAGLVLLGLRLRARMARIAVIGVLVFMVSLSAAFAGQTPIPTETLVAGASYILTGEVVTAEGRMASDNRIYTDVVVKVRDVVKGELNQGSTLSFSVMGGIYGSIVTSATTLPGFTQGDQALLYLQDSERFGIVPFGGYRSKVAIVLDPETDEEALVNDGTLTEGEAGAVEGEGESASKSAAAAPKAPAVQSKSVPSASGESGLVPLDAYLHYLRGLVHSQR